MTLGEAALVIRDLTSDPICGRIHLLCREALSQATRAMAAAERTGDTDARFLALQARHADRTDFRCSAERLEIGTLALTLGREAGRQGYAAWDHVWWMDTLSELGRRMELDAELTGRPVR